MATHFGFGPIVTVNGEALAGVRDLTVLPAERNSSGLIPATRIEVQGDIRFVPNAHELCGQDTFDVTLYEDKREWEFPHDRFITYGPEDEWSCRWLGIGREVTVRHTRIMRRCLLCMDGFASGKYTIESYGAIELRKETIG